MGKIIAVVNQKGGVGKTTTCVNLSHALHKAGKRILLCDSDPQANATSGLGVDKSGDGMNLYDMIIENTPAEQVIVQTPYCDLIPSNKELSGAGIEMISLPRREYRLRDSLNPIRHRYDFVLIDCPPSLELLTLNALCAADSILIPVQCEYYALEGLSDLMSTARIVKKSLNHSLEIEGVLMTMFDGRTNLSVQVAEEVKRYFPGKVYSTFIPRNVRLSEAPSHGKPAEAYDPYSKGAEAYTKLGQEFLRRNPSA